MAGHYSGLLQTMEVRAAGQAKDFTFQSGKDRTHLGWQSNTWTFTANTPQTTLAFYSLQAGYPYGGPALDNVVVQKTQQTAGGSNPPPGSGAPISTVEQITPAMIG